MVESMTGQNEIQIKVLDAGLQQLKMSLKLPVPEGTVRNASFNGGATSSPADILVHCRSAGRLETSRQKEITVSGRHSHCRACRHRNTRIPS